MLENKTSEFLKLKLIEYNIYNSNSDIKSTRFLKGLPLKNDRGVGSAVNDN